jgi:short-subunit dehydrogenase involved in D-alanine esterification of teichoic acids
MDEFDGKVVFITGGANGIGSPLHAYSRSAAHWSR